MAEIRLSAGRPKKAVQLKTKKCFSALIRLKSRAAGKKHADSLIIS
jgi:hypothetical protein